MGRPREFDEGEALERALQVFWTRGYEATSVTDLMDATGLSKGSLYKAFGDKHQLFLRALDDYLDRGIDRLVSWLDDDTPRAVLRRWLLDVVDIVSGPGLRRGCLAVNCAVELAPHDPIVLERLRHQESTLLRVYADLLREGVAQGEFRDDLDPDVGARWLTTVIDGLQVRGKLGLERREAVEAVDLALAALDAPGGVARPRPERRRETARKK